MRQSEVTMKEFRCKKCRKLLGKIKGVAEIKCTRCKTLNRINTEHQEKVSAN